MKADENIKQKSSVFPWLFALAPRIILYLHMMYYIITMRRPKISREIKTTHFKQRSFFSRSRKKFLKHTNFEKNCIELDKEEAFSVGK
jgi:hypothetical protein